MRPRNFVLCLPVVLFGLGLPCLVEVAAAPKAGAALRTVTFNKVLPKPGLVRQTSDETSMGFTLRADGKTLKMSNKGSKRKTEKLLHARGSIPTKVEVSYQSIVKSETQNGKTRRVPSPLLGKTYVVEVRGGQLHVTASDDSEVSAEERTLISEEYRSLGKPNFMLDGIPSEPVRIGARIPSMEEAMKKSFAESMGGKPGETWQISDPIVVLKGKGRADGKDVALLDFSMSMTMTQQGDFSMTMHMKGTVTIRLADGWPVRMVMKGPMDIMGTKNAGTMNMSQKIQYK